MAFRLFGGRAAPEPSAPAAPGEHAPHARWNFEEGHAVAPGRHALRRLGGGSRYEVYLVWDETLFALAVAKLLRPDQASDARALRELRREAEILARLAHPNLVRGYGGVLEGPYPHLLLEHVEGPTLERLVRHEGPLALAQLVPLALHLLAALHYLAASGVVHLDVKPGNVVMSGPPRLIDLSIARPLEDARALRAAIGTDPYMAPEQCAPGGGAPSIGPEADVWAAGATLFHAATGRVPFPRASDAGGGGDARARFPQLMGNPEPLRAAVPEPFAAIVLRMLARDPAARPTAREAAEALEPIAAAVPARLVPSRRRGLVPPR
jgi:eukaryotic-like serine/threonine-protein kinase